MRPLIGCWMFWYILLFEKNKTLKAYRITRLKGDALWYSNALWTLFFLFISGEPNYYFILPIATGICVIHVIVQRPFINEVKVFIKSNFSDNYIRAMFQTWLNQKSNREAFLEELYMFERAVFDKWVAGGGPERERIEEEERRRKRKAEFEEFKNEIKSAWHEMWQELDEKWDNFNRSRQSKQDDYGESNNFEEEYAYKQSHKNFNERITNPNKWALQIMELPTNTTDFNVIRSKYRSLMKLHHPDVGGDELKCKQLIDAYGVLTEAYGKKAS
ncbi:hypothetical protein [Cohnella yongneupensis]|uniref:J domain-containing protein n=1 Tax=Cohnella yongneupensis TaxID=425006 RepID=A0ABW0QZV7_9BACL